MVWVSHLRELLNGTPRLRTACLPRCFGGFRSAALQRLDWSLTAAGVGTVLVYGGPGLTRCDSAELAHPSFPLLLWLCFLIFWFTPPVSFLLQALARCPLPAAWPWSEPLPFCSRVPSPPWLHSLFPLRNRLQQTAFWVLLPVEAP